MQTWLGRPEEGIEWIRRAMRLNPYHPERFWSHLGRAQYTARAYAEAIRLIEAGRFPLERMHTHTFGLEDVPRAIETLAGEVPGEDAVHVAIMPGA